MTDIHLNNYLGLIVEVLPSILQQLESQISRRDARFSKLSASDKDDFLGWSYVYSTNQLMACADALRTLEFLSHKSTGSLQVNVTQNGVAGLLRQALESLSTFAWLNAYSNDSEARQKAHSYHIADLQERANYYKDLGEEKEVEKTISMLESARIVGLEEGYSRQEPDKNGKLIHKQLVPLPGLTDLCARILTPEDVITEGVLRHYPGMKDASWLYRWSSGLAHGKFWVNLFTLSEGDMHRTVPNYLNLSVMLLTLIKEINSAIQVG